VKITTRTPPANLKFGGRIGPGLKLAAGTVVATIVSWFLGKKIEKIQQESLQRDLERARPEIEKTVQGQRLQALNLLAAGKPAFAVIRVSLEYQEWHQGPGLGYMPTAPGLKYLGLLQITDSRQEDMAEDGENHDYFNAPGSMAFTKYYKLWLEVTFSSEEIALYRAYRDEIAWYENEISKVTAQPDALRLSLDRNALVDRLKKALGE
jgi:hypothetical protein